jgi:hypothetical protein
MRRLNINLFDDEYEFLKRKSANDRLSMNKLFQFWIRDLMSKMPQKIETPKEIKDDPELNGEKIPISKSNFTMPQSFGKK